MMDGMTEILDFTYELCNGTLSVESYTTQNPGERRVRLTDRLAGDSLTLRWEQWEELKEAIEARVSVKVFPPLDEA